MKTTFHDGKRWVVTAIRKHPFEYAELARPGERCTVAVHRIRIHDDQNPATHPVTPDTTVSSAHGPHSPANDTPATEGLTA
ncbi:hypothetical protein DW322_08730 [Rhodococcus rhodnii]|uniref:Uncharacterized protein n=2 Tax=Rhodococcus rhodnii TaxID=38312 RepID=R7WRM7_9NOCA|nr:hypothetical protein [Rhodococcus rhodnii]EOM77930.1 hypothetical protein Rrhod_0739 [Rhodococcus rhodnii LMG 5362]TXG90292.1 hypothetical protein DW322_08730 [Rhodococcus rhodnii]